MSDTAPSPAPAAGLTQAQIDSGLAALRRSGMSEDQIAAGMSGAARTGEPPVPPAIAKPGFDIPDTPNLGAHQAAAMANALLRAGVDPARIEEALKADGIELTADLRSEEERVFDRTFGPPLSPDDYRIDWAQHGRR